MLHHTHIANITNETDFDNQDDQEQWHIRRRCGIGGSDVGAILGVNPYRTPFDVWQEKTGRVGPADLSDNDAVMAGTLLEDAVAEFYTLRTEARVRRSHVNRFHHTMPWLSGNVDRTVEGQQKILECKTAGHFAQGWGEPGTDQVPNSYLLQCMHYMAVWGYKTSDLAVLTGGQSFAIYTIDFDQELFDSVAAGLRGFWFDNVLADKPPEPSNLREIEQFYRKDDGQVITADQEIMDAIGRYNELKVIEKETKDGLDSEKEIIKGFMGENATLVDMHGQKLATWKTQTANRLDGTALKSEHPDIHAQYTKESDSRVFRV
ncbi:YqaJ viral recombinase family protein [Porticoccaceae bacterium]|nr:YqaJ viral recombinase family protein [Porticoccaceae bacterium]